MKKFSSSWKGSKKPGKQRKYRANAPFHLKQKLVHSHLSKDLRKKYSMRSIGVRKGDKVKIMVGKFKKTEGKVERVDIKTQRIFVSGAETPKKDGSKKQIALNPSNLMIIELNLDDKLRQKALENKK